MDCRLPHISPSCPDHSPHPKKMDNGLSHPSGFPVTASTRTPMLHPSNHRLPISYHIPAAACIQGVAKGPSRLVNIVPQHSPIPATTNAHTSPCCLPTTQRVANGPSRTFDIASWRSPASASQRRVPATIPYTRPCHFTACASEWPIGPLIHSTSCPSGRPHSHPNDYHPTQALPRRSERLNPTSSRQAPLSSRHCAPAIVSTPIPASTARIYPIASQ
jgi:hypothetical protein